MKRILTITFLVVQALSFAQVSIDSSAAVTGLIPDSLQNKYKKVMIIPFEENMYVSGIQPFLAATSGKTHNEILDHFRYSIAKEMQNQFLYLYNTTSLIHLNDTAKDLYRTYSSLGYEFVELEVPVNEEEQSETAMDRAKNLFKSKTTPKQQQRGTIKNGQIVSDISTKQKVAVVKINKKQTVEYLHKKYGADLFVFITELDIQDDITDQFNTAEPERFLRVHYSIVDKKGNIIDKGMVYTKFPSSVNDIKVISSTYFPIVAKKLAAKLPQPIVPKVDPKKPVNALEKVKN